MVLVALIGFASGRPQQDTKKAKKRPALVRTNATRPDLVRARLLGAPGRRRAPVLRSKNPLLMAVFDKSLREKF